MNVYLTKPKLEDEEKLREYVSEFTSIEDGEGSNLLHSYIRMNKYPIWVKWCQENNSNTFLIMNDLGSIVGIINIRYKLDKVLEECGGHIGYNIRPSMRLKGYATEALRQLLSIAREHNLDELFIDCYKDNEGSLKTIEAVGGVLIRDEYNEARRHNVLRYRVNLRELKLPSSHYKSSLSRIDKISKVKIDASSHENESAIPIEEYFNKKEDLKSRLALEYLSEVLRINPDLSEDMLSPDLRKYLGIAKREYKKEEISSSQKRI